MRLFWRDGYSRTGVSSIIQKAGATSGSFYHFFATKEDLFLAVLDQFEERLEEMVHLAAADRTESAPERVISLFALHRQHLERHNFDFGLSLASLAADLGDDQAKVRKRVAAIFEHWQRSIQTELVAKDGPPDPESHDLAGFILALLEGATLQACVARSSDPFTTSERQLRHHLDRSSRLIEDHPPADAAYQPVPGGGGSGGKDWRAW